ncbi:MAG: ATP-binding cassette domain-containing protein, partial [Deltaproteobacteria bacterium]|nr:ATP-binding cassette domain-containing protein [Deltaproteobacteria bacterium]
MPETTEITVKDLNFYYSGTVHVLKSINLPVYKNSVTALIGPSGCGKTTLLRCFNRMHDLYPNNRYEGEERVIKG